MFVLVVREGAGVGVCVFVLELRRFLLALMEGNLSMLSGSRDSSSICCLRLGTKSGNEGEDAESETLSELLPLPLLLLLLLLLLSSFGGQCLHVSNQTKGAPEREKEREKQTRRQWEGEGTVPWEGFGTERGVWGKGHSFWSLRVTTESQQARRTVRAWTRTRKPSQGTPQTSPQPSDSER